MSAMIQVPGSKTQGSTPIYRNALLPHELFGGPKDIQSLSEAFDHGVKTTGKNAPCLGHRPFTESLSKDGTVIKTWGQNYIWQTYGQVQERRLAFGSGLVSLFEQVGIKKNQENLCTFGLYGLNCPEWVIADISGTAYDLVSVPLFDTLGAESVEYIVNHADLSIVVTTVDKIDKLISVASKCPSLKFIICMNLIDKHPAAPSNQALEKWKHVAVEKGIGIFTFDQVEAMGRSFKAPKVFTNRQSLFTICYTSGTTGDPKGVMLTHDNVISASSCMETVGFKIGPQDSHISYLPLAHCYERVCIWTNLYYGVRCAFFRGDVSLLIEDIQLVKPTIFISVPRLLNRIYTAILQKAVHSGSFIKSKLFLLALERKKQYIEKYNRLDHPVWDRLVFNKVKEALGGRVRIIMSGSAPISGEVLTFLRACFSCEVSEGWGQTETAAPCSVNMLGDYKAGGCVGPIAVCAEVKLEDIPDMNYYSTDKPFPRGEICVRGRNIMRGYYKDAKKTAETIDKDGWLHTGDIGTINERGLLKLIDRKKHIFKLSQGEYVAPEKLENIFSRCPFVAQIFIYGDSMENELVTVIVPDPEHSVKVAIQQGLLPANTPVPSPITPITTTLPAVIKSLSNNHPFKQLILADLAKIAEHQKLSGFEIPKGVILEFESPWSVENGLLTPTMKLKRQSAKEKYETQIKAWYIQRRKDMEEKEAASSVQFVKANL